MEFVDLEKIVKKYENGATSLQEEITLRNYFTGGADVHYLQEYEYLFHYFAKAKEETYTKNIQLNPKTSKIKNLKWFSVAAAILVLFSLFIGKKQQDAAVVKEQYAHVVKTLEILSSNLKKGEQAVATLYTYKYTINKILK